MKEVFKQALVDKTKRSKKAAKQVAQRIPVGEVWQKPEDTISFLEA